MGLGPVSFPVQLWKGPLAWAPQEKVWDPPPWYSWRDVKFDLGITCSTKADRFPFVSDRASFILWRGTLSSMGWKMVMAFAREAILDWEVPSAPEN